MEQKSFLPLKHFRCGPCCSEQILNVLPRHLELNREYWTAPCHVHGWERHQRTLFRDVDRTAPPVQMPVWLEPPAKPSVAAVLDALQVVLLENWDPAVPHVVLHSSGYDSRVLSALIKHLWREKGDGWLGHTRFLCTQWEGSQFKRIMEHQQWPPEMYEVYGEGSDRYFDRILNFGTAWQQVGGTSTLPTRLAWYLTQDLPPSTQVWSTWLANEVYRNVGRSGVEFAYFFRDLSLHEEMNSPGFPANTILPFADMRVASAVRHASVRDSRELVARLDYGLAGLKRLDVPGDKQQQVDDETMARCIWRYRQSWYGREVDVGAKPVNVIAFSKWWRSWTSASFTEHLLQEGYKLTVK